MRSSPTRRPADEQDRIAGWLQSELVSEEGWTRRFAQSQDLLNTLADEALADLAGGRWKFRTKRGRHTEPLLASLASYNASMIDYHIVVRR